MRKTATLLALLALLASAAAIGAEENAERTSPLGRQVADFSLKDFRGKEHSLADFHDQKLLVVAFTGTECPLAKLYSPRLVKLAKQFERQGVGFVAINSNCQDSITEIAAQARICEIHFPILKDLGNQVADQMGAVRTPEVFVLDAERKIRYWGRVDNQYGIGFIRDEPTRNDLQIALEELLAGKPVSQPVTEADGCFIGRVRVAAEESEVTFSNQISRVLQNRCVDCHRPGQIAPFSLTDYEEVVGWAETIEEVVKDQRMPPWHAKPGVGNFSNDRHMTDDEKELIYQWVANGAPEGDPADLPAPKQSVDGGWQLPRDPDAVVYMRDEPFKVQAEGQVRYQYFQADPGFDEDKWIEAVEVKPGNLAVVHHILVFARTPGGALDGAGGGAHGFLAGYVPGRRAVPFPAGMAKHVPAGSKLVFQVHYTPIGTEQLDRSSVAFVFADPQTITHEVETTSVVQNAFRIPPGAENHEVTGWSRGKLDESLLLSMMPHMHLRGKSFSYEAVYPNGKKEMLLDIPAYDFNWQTSYRLTEPKPLPAGTRVYCVAHFDNSENNLSNPNPAITVGWGDQTDEEMMIGYFDVAKPLNSDGSRPVAKIDAPPITEVDDKAKELASRLIKQFDQNRDGVVQRSEMPERMKARFDNADLDSDGVINLEELARALAR